MDECVRWQVNGRMPDTLPHATIASAGPGQLTTGAEALSERRVMRGFVSFFQRAPKVLTMRSFYRRELLTSAPRGVSEALLE